MCKLKYCNQFLRLKIKIEIEIFLIKKKIINIYKNLNKK